MTNIDRAAARAGTAPLTLDDFREMGPGDTDILHYHCYNQGSFVWIHDRVEGDQIFGHYLYPGERFNPFATPEAGALYVFEGLVVRGSGAEPVFREMPDQPTGGFDSDEEGA